MKIEITAFTVWYITGRNMMTHTIALGLRRISMILSRLFRKRGRSIRRVLGVISRWFYRQYIFVYTCPEYFVLRQPGKKTWTMRNFDLVDEPEGWKKAYTIIGNLYYYII